MMNNYIFCSYVNICIYSFLHLRWGQSSAVALNCSFTTDVNDQIQCLQNVSLDKILSSSIQVGYKGAHAVIDGNFATKPFLPDHPKSIMSKGLYNKDVNILLGSNRYTLPV